MRDDMKSPGLRSQTPGGVAPRAIYQEGVDALRGKLASLCPADTGLPSQNYMGVPLGTIHGGVWGGVGVNRNLCLLLEETVQSLSLLRVV